MKPPKAVSPIKASTQDFIEIKRISDDILFLKDYSACVIIASGGTNFQLLSEDEQISMIASYGGLLNSLSFPVQIVILSKKMDISSYRSYLESKIASQKNPILHQRLEDYRSFIQSIITKNTILEKKFYFVIPFSPLEIGVAGARPQALTFDRLLARAKASLYPKRDHLLRLLKKAGLEAKTLAEPEMTSLFYNIYNPLAAERKLVNPESGHTIIISEQPPI